MDSLITVIIPVYNREHCLARCLDSIRRQIFANWECIIIDDGSTDQTLSICLNYAEIDSRFRVFSQPNGGVSAARNRGLEEARGKYINFVDSDDWVETNYLQLLYESAVEDTFSFCGLERSSISGIDRMEGLVRSDKLYLLENETDELLIDCLVDTYVLRVPGGKLYSRKLIEKYQVRFPLGISWGEDTIFNFTYLRYISKAKGVPFFLYHNICQEESLSVNAKHDFFQTDVNQKIYDCIFDFIKFKGLNHSILQTYMNDYYAVVFFQTIGGVLYVHDRLSWKERYKQMKRLVAQVDRAIIKKSSLESNFFGFKKLAIYFKMSVLIFSLYEIKYFLLHLNNTEQ